MLFNDLRRASYQGIYFSVTSSDLDFGRRTVVHEYPQRDEPYVEDLGKKTRKISFKAFILGSDYILRAKTLVKMLENTPPETGGRLIHPWLGSLRVFPVETPKITWNTDKRIAVLELNFVEAGEHKYPVSLTSWASSLLEKANTFFSKILGDYHPEEISAYVDEVAELANGSLKIIADSSFVKYLNLGSKVNNLMADMASLLMEPNKLKNKIISDLSISDLAATTNDWQKITLNGSTLCRNITALSVAPLGLSVYASAKTVAVTKAAASLETSFRQVMLSNAIAGASFIGSDYDQNPEGTLLVPFAEDVLQIRDDLMKSLENEMLLTGIDEDDTYTLLSDSHTAVYNQLTSLADTLGGVETFTPTEVESSLVIAYDKYEDASRDLEVVQRNNIANPLFVGCTPLKISSV